MSQLDRIINTAKKAANNQGEDIYIVIEDDTYDYATMYDLDTFYAGIHESHILAVVYPGGEVEY